MKSLLKSLLISAAFLLPAPVFANISLCDAVSGNLITNCGFESGNLNGWSVIQPGAPNVTGSGAFAPNSGSFYAQFGPTPVSIFGESYGIASSFTTPETSCACQVILNVSWSFNSNGLAGGPFIGELGSGLVLLDGGDNGGLGFDVSATNGWVQYSFNEVVGTGNHMFEFLFNDMSNTLAVGLDDVVITAETPEPGGTLPWLLFAATACLLVAARRSVAIASKPR